MNQRKAALSDTMTEQNAPVTTLWKFPRETFDEWIQLGMGEADTYQEYLNRLHDAEQAAAEQGILVAYCTATPRCLYDWMIRESLDPTDTRNRATAIAMYAMEELAAPKA